MGNPASNFKVGKETVYLEQRVAAQIILEEFADYSGPPLLIAQTQQGKTGVALCVAETLREIWEKENLTYEIIFLLHISDNDLKQQQEDRLQSAGLYAPTPIGTQHVKILHHSDLRKKLKDGSGYAMPTCIDLSVQKRLIILDECHQALGDQKPIHQFLQKLGISYGSPVKTWDNQNNYLLSMSATPFAAVVQSKILENSFSIVVIEQSASYYSIKDAKDDGRFIYVPDTSVFDMNRSNVTPFFKDRIEEFIQSCNKFGNGHLVIRTREDGYHIIDRYLSAKYGNKIWLREYSTLYGSKPINQLNKYLSEEPGAPSIVIIKGAMRAGKTLDETKYIRGHIECYKKDDSCYQSLGRYLGFPTKCSGHPKSDDIFPIFMTDHKVVDNIIEFFDGNFTIVPGGVWNNRTKDDDIFDVHIFDVDYSKIPSGIDKTVKNNEIKKQILDQTGIVIKTVRSISANSGKEADYAKDAQAGKKRSADNYALHIDGPSSMFPDSWDALCKDHPELIGKCMFWTTRGKKIDYDVLKKKICFVK